MRVEYDPKYNIAYIRFLDSDDGDLQTLHISEELNIDLMPDGRLFGIELLNANEQLFGLVQTRVTVLQGSGGRTKSLVSC